MSNWGVNLVADTRMVNAFKRAANSSAENRPRVPGPEETATWNAYVDTNKARATMKSSGLEAALLARKGYEEGQARRGGFLNAAQRGFIGGGMAVTAAEPAMADVAWNAANREQEAFNAEMAKLTEQRRADATLYAQNESNQLQREANKPKGLFAGLFG